MKGQAYRESGQAVVEYLLLAVVTLGLILGMSKVFGKLNKGAQKYMGDYIVCLMDYGELPTLGLSSGAGLSKHDSGATCDRKFEEFTFGEGRPPVSTPGTTSSGSTNPNNPNSNNSSITSKNGSGNNSDSKNKTNSQNSDGAGGASDLAKAGEDGSSGSSSKSPYKSGQVQRKGDVYGTLDGGSSEGRSRVIDSGEDDDAAGAGGRNRRQGRRGRNNTIYYGENYRAITGGKAFDALNKQLKKTQARKPTATIRSIAKEDGRVSASYRKEITPREEMKAPPPSSDDGKFTFGNFMRWLLIAGMVIAIVIFFGGQVMNYSNSSD